MLRRSILRSGKTGRSMTGIAVVGLVAVVAAGCSSSSGNKASSGSSSTPAAGASTSAAAAPSTSAAAGASGAAAAPASTGKTLVVENNPVATMTDTFNPFSATAIGKTVNAEALFYEPLIQFNNTKAGQTYPWLAQSYTWNADGTAITFKLRDGVKWSDGQAFTADDVAYTFQLMQNDKALNYSGLPITGETTSGTDSVTITFSSAEYTNIYAIAGQTWIVPKHIWSAQSAPETWTDPTPVGTGPFILDKFSPQGFTAKANPNYWGGAPKVPEVSFPAFASNTTALTALQKGEIDYTGNDIDNIQTNFVAKDPAHNHYYFPATNTVVLLPNTATWPFSNKAVRLAVSAGMNRSQLSSQGETGYEPPATSSSGLLLPNYASNVPASMVNDLQATPDTAKVTSIMTAAGFAKDSKGFWALSGKEVAFNVEDPTAYTDYYADSQIIAAGLKPLGFNVTVDGVSPDKWNSDLAAGTFSSAVHWGSGGPSAYAQYDGWLDYNLASTASASGDQGRWNDPATQTALTQYAAAGTPAAQQTAINALATIVSTEAPVIPLLYGAGWFEYSSKNYTGWPTQTNSYIDPSPNPANVEYTILQLTPAAS